MAWIGARRPVNEVTALLTALSTLDTHVPNICQHREEAIAGPPQRALQDHPAVAGIRTSGIAVVPTAPARGCTRTAELSLVSHNSDQMPLYDLQRKTFVAKIYGANAATFFFSRHIPSPDSVQRRTDNSDSTTVIPYHQSRADSFLRRSDLVPP
ncbi:hypothetical protein K461DRAFT_270216 [Myriangium duriaei CBS 260.36]|uniref:Uncharacterized protein n=1 Tax=Myriangium duriaei CBS 260.36 TaxID=1168546 RepID=A0A9P4ME70_9PEZI|nr:hypothetical protein K461DRAFT_270216 [Myriangium duriaei CBS 260.36]